MRHLLWLALCSSCATSPEAPLSSATLTVDPAVHSARADQGFVSYGAAYHRWTVTFATVEGCGVPEKTASVELVTLASVSDTPLGTINLRATQTTVATLPSGYLDYMGGTLISGTVTIDSAIDGFVVGSLSAQLMVNGTATDVSGTFSAPSCR